MFIPVLLLFTYVDVCCRCLHQCLIHEVDYENELDLVYAVVTNGGSPSSTFLVFFDDWTGNILKTFPLETWQEVGDHVCLSAVWRSCVPECSVEIMCA